LIGPVIDAPQDIPTIAFSELDSLGWTWKLPAVEAFVGDRPVAWLDDDPGEGADDWAVGRMAPTTLIRPIPHLGWTSAETDLLLDFAARAGE
jgi:hypothetical protein